MIERSAFRAGMTRLGAAVNIITTDGPAGRGGFAASAVCSVTDDPPTLLICVNKASRTNALLRQNGVVCVNVLAGGHAPLSVLFSSRDVAADQCFAPDDAWMVLETGAPVLRAASAALDCHIDRIEEVGTHDVVFCRVEAIRLSEKAEALIYFDRAYHSLTTI